MNFYVICNYIDVFNVGVWGTDFLRGFVYYFCELLTFCCVGYIVISTLIPCIINFVHAAYE